MSGQVIAVMEALRRRENVPMADENAAIEAVRNLAIASKRVLDAFRALGVGRGVLAEARAKQECEAAMLALEAAHGHMGDIG